MILQNWPISAPVQGDKVYVLMTRVDDSAPWEPLGTFSPEDAMLYMGFVRRSRGWVCRTLPQR